MKKPINNKRIFSVIAGCLFVFTMFFNTTISYSKTSEASLSLINLETAQAQEEVYPGYQECWYNYEEYVCETIEVIPGVFDTICLWVDEGYPIPCE